MNDGTVSTVVALPSRPGDPPGSRREQLKATFARAYAAETPNGCITALRIQALAQPERFIVDDRVQCSFNPLGPDRPHEFNEACPVCHAWRCPHCHCHVQ